MEKPNYEEVLNFIEVPDEHILGVYMHGSRLYGTYTDTSGTTKTISNF
jgi:hypothetical protein